MPRTQDSQWEDLPPELKDMISKRVKADRIARLRVQRRLTFHYVQNHTCPNINLTRHFRDEIDAWNSGHYNAQAAEALLRHLFDLNFRLRPQASNPPTQNDDDVNITPAEWAQVVLRIVSVQRIYGTAYDDYGPWHLGDRERALFVMVESDPVPGQGQHNLIIVLPFYEPTANPNRPHMWINYSGFLSWQMFNRPTGELSDRRILPGHVANQYIVNIAARD